MTESEILGALQKALDRHNWAAVKAVIKKLEGGRSGHEPGDNGVGGGAVQPDGFRAKPKAKQTGKKGGKRPGKSPVGASVGGGRKATATKRSPKVEAAEEEAVRPGRGIRDVLDEKMMSGEPAGRRPSRVDNELRPYTNNFVPPKPDALAKESRRLSKVAPEKEYRAPFQMVTAKCTRCKNSRDVLPGMASDPDSFVCDNCLARPHGMGE